MSRKEKEYKEFKEYENLYKKIINDSNIDINKYDWFDKTASAGTYQQEEWNKSNESKKFGSWGNEGGAYFETTTTTTTTDISIEDIRKSMGLDDDSDDSKKIGMLKIKDNKLIIEHNMKEIVICDLDDDNISASILAAIAKIQLEDISS